MPAPQLATLRSLWLALRRVVPMAVFRGPDFALRCWARRSLHRLLRRHGWLARHGLPRRAFGRRIVPMAVFFRPHLPGRGITRRRITGLIRPGGWRPRRFRRRIKHGRRHRPRFARTRQGHAHANQHHQRQSDQAPLPHRSNCVAPLQRRNGLRRAAAFLVLVATAADTGVIRPNRLLFHLTIPRLDRGSLESHPIIVRHDSPPCPAMIQTACGQQKANTFATFPYAVTSKYTLWRGQARRFPGFVCVFARGGNLLAWHR
jgi:hypothetical protein